MKKTALIGYTGFVGSNLAKQFCFDSLYNSGNINEIIGNNFDLVVCAGARAEKWKANLDPENDLNNIKRLEENLIQISTKLFILISTVDVYLSPNNVFEDTPIKTQNLSPYGLHRYMLEIFVREHFNKSTIIRLPALFGAGLKKNFLFDMLKNPNALHLTHSESKYQFYGLNQFWKDIQCVIKSDIDLINFGTQPVSPHEVAHTCFNTEFTNITSNGPIYYDMRTLYGKIFGYDGDYIRTQEEELNEIKYFVYQEKKRL